ncbi:MAG: bifunctional UDP-N-acetylglucosamine diphosphorylase/glucosamine-1-phosphate N-acetyltransferase GlmU [Rhodovibrionaceae bacterium]
MTGSKVSVVVLAAGRGDRMRSARPKVLHEVAGLPMIRHVLRAAAPLQAKRTVVVVGPGMDDVAAAVAPCDTAIQPEPLGTGHAVLAARAALGEAPGDVLVLYGDGPLISTETLQDMLAARQRTPAPELVWLAMQPENPTGYGRILLDGEGAVERIVEERDASAEERKQRLCWGGLLLGEGETLFRLLEQVGTDNARGEYYLTALVELGRKAGCRSVAVETAHDEVRGVNSRAELAQAERIFQGRLREKAMAGGATLIDPATVWLSADSEIGEDVVLEPNVVLGPGVVLETGCRIRAFSHLEGARVETGAVVGPFARLRPGAVIGADARIGNFVEIKNARLGKGAKANHLSYLGDAEVGAGANIGAGTITCNYDGYDKHRTLIGAGAFIGSNTALVAPVAVGANAIVAAGSTLTKDTPADALATTRGAQRNLAGWAAKFRQKKSKTRKDR